MIRKIFEVAVARALPGAISLVAILGLGNALSTAAFGVYATVVATFGFVASMMFGPLTYAIVSQYAKSEAEGNRLRYESAVFTAALGCALVLCGILGAVIWLGLLPMSYLALAPTLGLYTVALEFPRARLRYWSYGVASLVQSIAFIGAIHLLVRHPESIDGALYAFSLSYLSGLLASLYLNGLPQLSCPDLTLLNATVRSGGAYTISLALESCLYLGMRFILLTFSTPHVLGIFSFGVELGQRSVGIFANIISFALLPFAFREVASDRHDFIRTLFRGGAMSAALCVAAVAGVFIVRWSGYVPSLARDIFDPATFAILSAAIIINRTKKMVVDPLAMREQTPLVIALGFAIGAPVAVSLAIILDWRSPQFYAGCYLLGYCVVFVTTIFLLYREMRRNTP